MSLLNAWVRSDRAMIAVDTDTLLGGVQHEETSKLIPLVHANTVFAARGDRVFLHRLFEFFYLASLKCDYDDIAKQIPNALATLIKTRRAQGQRATYQAAVVGWSPTRQEVAGVWFSGDTAEDAFDIDPLGQRLAPWEPPQMGVPVMPSSIDAMTQIARVQADWLRAQPNSAGGGRLIVAEITKDRMTIESVANLNGARK